MQSAYRKNHSCETALLRVHNDLLLALDSGEEAVLILLDFSAAFETIRHDILHHRLQHRFGFTGKALQWLKSYMAIRSQSVLIRGKSSTSCSVQRGVPQGSVPGPTLYSLYSSPLEDLILANGFKCVIYADDTQLYSILKKDELSTVIPRLQSCLRDIKDWSLSNDLKINVEKTELLHLSSRFRKKNILPSITFNKEPLDPVQCVRNLGVIFDDQLTMQNHMSNMCRSSSYALHVIGKARKYLDQATTEKLVHAFVMSRLDNCNSLLYGLPVSLLSKMQSIQNSAARIVSRKRLHDHLQF